MTEQKLIEHWIQGCAAQRVMFRDGLVLNLEDYNELVISAPIRLTLPATATSPVEVVSVDPNDPAALLRPLFDFSGATCTDVTWDDANLDKFLANPAGFVHGTKMFVNLPSEADRQNVIAYLDTLKK